MNSTHSSIRNWVDGEFRFEEDHQRRPLEKPQLEKPQEVDEACYSLEDSPDLEETRMCFFGDRRFAGDYRRSDSGRDRSPPSGECLSETALVAEKECGAFGRRVDDVNLPLTSGGVFPSKDSGLSATLIPRGVSAFNSSEDGIPPETALAAEKECGAFGHSVNDVNLPLTSGGIFPSKDSGLSATLIPRGVAAFNSSEDSILPDFDRLLPNELEAEKDKSSSSSDYVRKMCQEMVIAGHSAHQIYDEINQSRFGGKLFDLEAEDSFDDVSADGSDDDSSWTEEECDSLVEMMRLSAQCADDTCDERKCHLGRRMILDIEFDLESLTMAMSMPTRRLLSAIIGHSNMCEDISCAVPYCAFFTQYREQQLSVEEMRAALQGWYRRIQLTQDFEELNVDIPDSAEFLQLDPDVVWPCMEHNRMHGKVSIYSRTRPPTKAMPPIPRNGIDFLVNGHFCRFGQLGLTALSTTLCPGAMMLNIVQYVSSENSRALWRSLTGLKHPHIVRHLWVCVDGNIVTLCRDHSCMDSESLESLVKKVQPPRRLDDGHILKYTTGLVSATRYLNDGGIFYLRWIASGIHLNYDYTSTRLSDFSSAINSTAIEEDEEVVDVVVSSLPPYILPPEIFSDDESFGRIGAFTEVWGVGCIIYHMCCHRPVHHDLRHQPPETLLETVEEFAPGKHCKSIKSSPLMLRILSKIFTREAERISLPALEELLLQELSSSSGR